MKQNLALDTNILLYALMNNIQFGKSAIELLSGKHGQELQVSALVITELLSHDSVKSSAEFNRIKELINSHIFRVKDIDEAVLYKAAKIRREYRQSLADSIHIASAAVNKAEYFISNDRDILKLKIKDIKLISLSEYESVLN